MDFDRETVASAFVATGGAWLLGSAAFRRKSGRWNAAQLRGMSYAGAGFLLSAASARWLQPLGNRGIAVSLVGTTLAMRGMYTLLRERAATSARGNTVAPTVPAELMESDSLRRDVSALPTTSTTDVVSHGLPPKEADTPRKAAE
jgi:hypothetical protein